MGRLLGNVRSWPKADIPSPLRCPLWATSGHGEIRDMVPLRPDRNSASNATLNGAEIGALIQFISNRLTPQQSADLAP